jgi:predicted amidohydrolase
MHVEADKFRNIDIARGLIDKAVKENIDIAVLPEMFCCPYETSNFPIYAQEEGQKFYNLVAKIAKDYGIYLVAGSMPEKAQDDKTYNTCYVFDRMGCVIAKHRKLHLFDIEVEGGQCFKESDTLSAGDKITLFNTEFGKMGLAICYDIRFPEIFRIMSDEGAKAIFVPAAFNMTTGPKHWEVLFRARALDSSVYMVGAATARDMNASYISYGNSIVVSPWGDVIDRLDAEEGYIVATLDLEYINKVRSQIPVLSQRRGDVYKVSRI